MGWFYGYQTNRKAYIESLNRDHCGDRWRILKQCYRGNIGSGSLWTVYERTDGSGERLLGHDLLNFHPHGWGHKPGDESCGPCEVNCPLAYLDLVPDPGGYATEWRERVRAYNARLRRKFAPGEIWTFPGCNRTVGRVVGRYGRSRVKWVIECLALGDRLSCRADSFGHQVSPEHMSDDVVELLAARAAPGLVADALEEAGCEAAEVCLRLRTHRPEHLSRLLAALDELAGVPDRLAARRCGEAVAA